MAVPRCEYPLRAFIHGHVQTVPCGQCYHCRRKIVRTRQGQAVLEQKFPYYPEHADPQSQHWLTVTYAHAPMTKPEPHKLGTVVLADGAVAPFRGPFIGGKSRIALHDGDPYWSAGRRKGELLSEQDLREEHIDYLMQRLKWNHRQVQSWEEGTYESVPTTRYADIQKYAKRIRINQQRKIGSESKLRYMAATEYGLATDRPHFHMAIWGIPLSAVDILYDAWSDQDECMGHINPPRLEARTGATIMRDRAATYQAKDLVKPIRELSLTPELMARERPKVRGSTRPPIGSKAYEYWFKYQIGACLEDKQIERVKQKFPTADDDVAGCILVRENYTVVKTDMPNGSIERFPTPESWRKKVREDLQIPDRVWNEASAAVAAARGHVHEVINTPAKDGGLAEEYDEFKSSLRERSKEKREQEKTRQQEKLARLRAAGRI